MTFPPGRTNNCPNPSLIGQTVRGRYFVESQLGCGTFGEVYKVIDLDSSSQVDGCIRRAMKVVDVTDPNQPRIPPPDYVNHRLNQAVREIYYHKLVSSHPNIVTLHEWFLVANRQEMFLIMDYCPGGDLRTYVTKGRNPFAGNDRRMKKIILQICDALDFIHSKGVFHKDIKPQNILVSRDGWKVFLCDFGLATDMRTDTRGGGTGPYMSPELLVDEGPYCPRRADAWTLGITIINMLGLAPWDSARIRSRRFRDFMLNDDHLRRVRPISPEANDLIREILRFHPELRLSIPEISARVLQLRSFFDDPRTRSTKADQWEMRYAYRGMLTRLDPIARRRKELERLRYGDETSVFNDLTGRLPSPQLALRRITVFKSPQQQHPVGVTPCYAPISGIPPPVAMGPEEPVTVHRQRWRIGNLMVAGPDWPYP